MSLQSKFGYCIITQTLNAALCLYAGRSYGRTDGQTDGRTEDPITRCPRRTFQAGKKTERYRLKWSQNAPFALVLFFQKFLGGVPRSPSFEGHFNHATLLQYHRLYSTEIGLRPRPIRQWI